MRLLSSLILCLALAVPAWGTTYYVDNTGGSDSWPGTSVDSAWATLDFANGTLSAGDTLLIRSGVYSEGVVVDIGAGYQFCWDPNGGSGGTVITYKGYPGDTRPRIRGDLLNPNGSGQRISVCYLSGKNDIVFDSLEFTNGNRAAIYSEAQSQNITIKNCVFDSIGHNVDQGENPSAIRTYNCDLSVPPYTVHSGWRIHNNVFFHVWANGHVANNAAAMQFYGLANSAIFENEIYDCGEGIYLKTQTSPFANDTIRDNTIYETASPVQNMDNAIHVHSDTNYNVLIHNNLIYGSIPFGIMLSFPGGCAGSYHYLYEIYAYNNTIDIGASSGQRHILIKMGEYSGANLDSFYIFNNIFCAPGQNAAIVALGSNNSGTNQAANFGKKFYEDYNLFIDTTGTSEYIRWQQLTGGDRYFTLQQWRDTCNSIDATHVCGDNTNRITSFSGVFVDRTNRDYRLASGSVAATGGANTTIGQVSAPSYQGAFAPSDTTCPTVTLVGPGDDTTIADYNIDIEANFTLDSDNDSLIVTLIGERGDATPEDTLFIDTLIADSSGWTYNWSSLTEDSTYYWYIIARDTSCADTSAIRQFLVDSIPAVVADTGTILRGVNLRGIKIGDRDAGDEKAGYTMVGFTPPGLRPRRYLLPLD